MGVLEAKWRKGCCDIDPNELVFTFGGFLRQWEFWSKLIKKCDRESAHRRTHRQTDANRFYNPSHAICYSYGTDNYYLMAVLHIICKYLH